MSYVPPYQVISPKDRWELDCVVYDGGPGSYAVAAGYWEEEPCLAIRWNGISEPHKGLGNPQSRGLPTWFILPNDFALAVLRVLEEKQDAQGGLDQNCLEKMRQLLT